MINQIETVLYTGRTVTTGGRQGESRSDDGRLDIKLSPPGSSGSGTNPEQLLGAGWSACFIGAMGKAATALKVSLPADVSVATEVDLGNTGNAYFLQACRAWTLCWPGRWWTRRIRLARTPRQPVAISMSRSTWYDRQTNAPEFGAFDLG
jgi:Ohr subfamily peroxiredoxin